MRDATAELSSARSKFKNATEQNFEGKHECSCMLDTIYGKLTTNE